MSNLITQDPIFQYHPRIAASYPQLSGGVILARNLANGPTPAALVHEYQTEQQAVLQRIGDTPLSEIESISAWRRAFRSFGVNPTKYRSAAEALLRRLTKKGDIPNINTLVDLCNLVSIRYALPVAAFDTKDMTGAITVHFADGSEPFTPLGRQEIERPQIGEVVFSDEIKMVVARRWCWRQSDESAARPETTATILTVEAQHPAGREQVEAAVTDLLSLLAKYAGGNFSSAVLDPQNPAFLAP